VLFIDIDNLSAVNEAIGHQAGDALAAEMARRFAAVVDLDRSAWLSRFACDTFVVVLDDVSTAAAAVAFAGGMQAALTAPISVGGLTVVSRASVGVTVGPTPAHPDRLLAEADTARREARGRGRARISAFAPDLGLQARRRLVLESDLQRAIDDEEITAVYQPIVHLETGRVVSFEALARWRHPELGNVSPAEFIPIAEDTGLITPLAHELLRRSLVLLDSLSRLPSGRELRMNVNVSRRQLCDPAFADSLRDLIAHVGVSPERLCLEITESVVAASDGVRDCLTAIKSLGVQLHMDDFGTGLSSLSLLQTLPIDGFKVDRSFIQAAQGNDRAIAILHAIVSLGRTLRKTVTAEGLEHPEQVATVIGLDCDLAQGWVFGESVPPHAAAWTLHRDFSPRLAARPTLTSN
jgi:diguanylate cyclase (GGDEF)-like protein